MAECKKEDEEKGKIVVHLLVIMMGVTSWSIMNGLWVELPILVANLPEGWTLPSWLTIISQFGNIGPLLFVLFTWLFPKTKLETPVSIGVVAALSVCAMMYAFLWRQTAMVGGGHVSIAILLLTLCQAIFAATSSMSYLAFMSHLKARYISSIFIGQGLSGLLPAFIAIGQGAGDVRCLTYSNISHERDHSTWNGNHEVNFNESTVLAVNVEPHFSVGTFFMLLFAMGCMSLVAVMFLVLHPYCKTEHVNTEEEENCQLLLTTNRNDAENTISKEGKHPPTTENHKLNYGDININNQSANFTLAKNTQMPNSDDEETTRTTHDQSANGEYDVRTTISTHGSLHRRYSNGSEQDEHNSDDENGYDYDENNQNNKDMVKDRELGTIEDHKFVTSNDVGQTEVKVETGNTIKSSYKEDKDDDGRQPIKRWESWYLLFLLTWINVLQTSYVLAIQVYSSLPYGLAIYNGVTKAENIVDPLACCVTLYVTAQRTRVISGLTLLGTLFAAYIITVAAMSPHPFLVNETMGGILVIAAWVMCTVLMVYSKVSIASVMRAQGRTSLIWTGGSSQLGALIGAVLAYVMINQLDLFKDEPWC